MSDSATMTTTTTTSSKKKKPIIACDLDEVLADFTSVLADFHNVTYGYEEGQKLSAKSFHSYHFHEVWGGTPQDCAVKVSNHP